MSDTITCTVHDKVAVVTLDDGKVNAMTRPFFEGLNAALDQAEKDAGALVITGRPGAFSAGLNLKVLPTLPPDELRRTLTAFGKTMLRVFTFPMPTIAAVSGHAIAGGAMLAFACDMRYLADGPFRLHLNETAIGLPLPTWALMLGQSAVPKRWHTEAMLLARAYSPAEALERDIVDDVVPPEQLLERALTAAAPLTALNRAAYATSKARHRAMAVEWAEARIEPELVGPAPGAQR